MDCGGGSDFGGGHSSFGGGGCSSSGADFGGSHFGGSDFGGMNTSHNTHFTSTTHSTFGAHPTSNTTQWTSTTVSGSTVNSRPPTNYCGLVFLVIFFIGWFGIAGFLTYFFATSVSPFLAIVPICFALFPIFCTGCTIYQNFKKQRVSRGGINVNQRTTTQPQVHPPPQQGAPPYPSSYPTSQQPQWTSAYSTNYGQQQYGMSGQQAPRASAPPAGSPEGDKPPSYDDVVKGGSTPLGFV